MSVRDIEDLVSGFKLRERWSVCFGVSKWCNLWCWLWSQQAHSSSLLPRGKCTRTATVPSGAAASSAKSCSAFPAASCRFSWLLPWSFPCHPRSWCLSWGWGTRFVHQHLPPHGQSLWWFWKRHAQTFHLWQNELTQEDLHRKKQRTTITESSTSRVKKNAKKTEITKRWREFLEAWSDNTKF